MKKLCFIDLFAGGGGLSEGFIQQGFEAIAHVEKDKAACNTLKTRAAFHYLKEKDRLQLYSQYLSSAITREQFYDAIPVEVAQTVINEEISEASLTKIFPQIEKLLEGRRLDLILGGPPCQAYSNIGRARKKSIDKTDPRNYLFLFYAEFLKKFKPNAFLFENVQGLLSAKSKDGKNYLEMMLNLFHEIGYSVEFQVLNAFDYGVLQERKRVILIGVKQKQSGFFPTLKTTRYYGTTVKDLFDDLPFLQAGEGSPSACFPTKKPSSYLINTGIADLKLPITQHWSRPNTNRDLKIYKIVAETWKKKGYRVKYDQLPENLKTHNNRTSFLDRYKVVADDKPFAHTVVSHIAKDGHYFIHPDIQQNRSLTPRELARLQSFPDNYFFESYKETISRTAAYTQIGNAVPVLLAQRLAEGLKKLL